VALSAHGGMLRQFRSSVRFVLPEADDCHVNHGLLEIRTGRPAYHFFSAVLASLDKKTDRLAGVMSDVKRVSASTGEELRNEATKFFVFSENMRKARHSGRFAWYRISFSTASAVGGRRVGSLFSFAFCSPIMWVMNRSSCSRVFAVPALSRPLLGPGRDQCCLHRLHCFLSGTA
jgi:hypothetical protein